MDPIPGTHATPAAEVRANLAGLRITPANVLQVRNALLAESQLMREKVKEAQIEAAVGEPGLDAVSRRAARDFNTKITALMDQWQAYVDALRAGAEELDRMARDYGFTEQQITASFGRFQHDNPPPDSPDSAGGRR